MVFDISSLPDDATISSVEFNGYLYENSWPYWSVTPMEDVNPITDAAFTIFNQVSSHSGEGVAYSYNEEAGTLSNDWLTRQLGSAINLDLQEALAKDWFAIGILDFDFSTSYYVRFHGWAEANKPYLKIIYSYHGVTTFEFTSDVEDGWNLVSVPGELPSNQNIDSWWAFRDMGASVFKYNEAYQSVTTVTPGEGYWMKHAGDRTYNTGEEWPNEGINLVPHNPITVNSGWNIFGGYEEIVPVSGLTTAPPGLMSGPVYGYSGGYFITSQLVPGEGYWTKLNGAGQIIIPGTFAKETEPIEWISDDWGKILFTDATGISYTLYAVNGAVNLDQYELPPAPMAGMFDIRYSSGRIAEDINSAAKIIEMNCVEFPLTVSVEGISIKLTDESGGLLNLNLKPGESSTITVGTFQKLMVSGESMPLQYSLEQNYPNPFNPTTNIKYSIPDVSDVTMIIYDVLGNEIEIIVNENQQPGSYEVKWDASNISSGIYFYQLKTKDFVDTKKMIVLK
jgi:hypothetical protein